MKQNSKQSQNNKTIKSQSVTFTIAVMKKKEKKQIKNLENMI